MSSLANQRLSKQDILLNQVKATGIDTAEFLEYLAKFKGEMCDNIDAWDQNELELAIQGFHEQKNISLSQGPEQQEGLKVVLPQSDKFFKEYLLCRQAEPNILSSFFNESPQSIVQPKIREYKIIDEGTFTPNYALYAIEVPEFGWSVWRRFNDFEWLRKCLIIQFPNSLIPPLPKKTLQSFHIYQFHIKTRMRKFTPEHISKRIRMLELFLTTVVNSTLYRVSDLLIAFLCLSEDGKFNAVVNGTNNMRKVQNYSDMTTSSGTVALEINPILSKYYTGMNSYLDRTLNVYKEVTDNSRQLVGCINQTKDKLTSVITNVSSLKDLTKQFDQQNLIGNLGVVQFGYNLMEDFLYEWKQSLEDLSNTATRYFYEFFRFQRDMQDQMLDMIHLRNKLEQTYDKDRKELDKKKEKMFNTEPIEKWELHGEYDKAALMSDKQLAFKMMLPKETTHVDMVRDKYAFLNKILIEQITQYYDCKGISLSQRLCDMLQKQTNETIKFNVVIQKIFEVSSYIWGMRNGEQNENLKEGWLIEYRRSLSVQNILK